MSNAKKRISGRLARHKRIRKKVNGTSERPRLTVRRSIKHIIAQIVDDASGRSLLQVTTASKEFVASNGSLNRVEQSIKLGAIVAEKAKGLGIETVVFDRGGFIYHGRVKALADGARESGLKF
jgi:large subunit ribosomal protein L18